MDLNDMRYFALTVEHGGFSAAARHAHLTKSKLSRRVGVLEAQLGVRLLARTTRRLTMTEAGRVFHQHCAAMLVEAQAAVEAVAHLRSEPAGTVRLSCAPMIAQFYVAAALADFMRQYPKVRVELDCTDEMVNLIDERIDVALRPDNQASLDPTLVSTRLDSSVRILVCAPSYAAAHPGIDDVENITKFDSIGSYYEGAEQLWSLVSATKRLVTLKTRPRLLCTAYTVQQAAAEGGVGIALLPRRVVIPALQNRRLIRIAADWSTIDRPVHLIYVSRRGMLPSVRALIDYLVNNWPKQPEARSVAESIPSSP